MLSGCPGKSTAARQSLDCDLSVIWDHQVHILYPQSIWGLRTGDSVSCSKANSALWGGQNRTWRWSKKLYYIIWSYLSTLITSLLWKTFLYAPLKWALFRETAVNIHLFYSLYCHFLGFYLRGVLGPQYIFEFPNDQVYVEAISFF